MKIYPKEPVSDEFSRFRQHKGIVAIIVKVATAAIPICGLLYLLDVPIYLRSNFQLHQYCGIFFTLTLSLAFLLFPAHKSSSKTSLPWYDAVLALLAVACGLYVTIHYPQIVLRSFRVTTLDIIFGSIAIPLILEGTRRACGQMLMWVGCASLFYAL